MKKRLIGLSFLFLMIIMLFASGCKKSANTTEAKQSGSKMDMNSTTNYSMDNGAASKAKGTQPMANEKKEESAVKKMIVTGDIRLVVEDLKKTSEALRNKVEEMEGYIESENLSEYNSNAKVRIPAEKLTSFIGYLEKDFEVESKNTNSQDITDAYVDNDARLKNLKVQEEQIQVLMKKANTVEEIMKVQNELFRVRGEIESLEARKRNWDRDVNFSTLNVIARKKQLAIESKIRILKGSEFGRAIGKGFTENLIGITLFLQNLVIFVLSNIIMLVILSVAGFFVYKKYLKGKIHLK